MVRFNSSRSNGASRGFTFVRRIPVTRLRTDPHAGVELSYLPAGWLTYLLGDRTLQVTAGQLAVFWAALPHQIIAHSAGLDHYLVATIPLSWFLSCHFPPGMVRALLHGRMICSAPGERPVLDRRMFASWERDMGDHDPETGQAMRLEMQARLHRLALTASPG